MNIMENGGDRGKVRNRFKPPKTVDPRGKQNAETVDKLSRKGFPIAFLIFNIIYWITYTVPSGIGNGH